MIEKIKKEVIEKGDMREGVTSYDLDQVHGCYKQNHQIVASLGGMLMQIVAVIQAFFEAFALPSEGEEAEKQKEKLKEFLTLEGITNFLLNFLKDAKFDGINLPVSQGFLKHLQE